MFTLHRMAAVCLGVAVAGAANAVALVPQHLVTVKIVGFNDYHGNLQSPGTFGSTLRSRRPTAPPWEVRTTWRVTSPS